MLQRNHEKGWQKKVNSRWTYTPRMDLTELLANMVFPYHDDIPKPRGLDIFTQGLVRIGAEPRHIGNHQRRCFVIEIGTNKQNAIEAEYDSQEESDAESLTVEPGLEPRDFPS